MNPTILFYDTTLHVSPYKASRFLRHRNAADADIFPSGFRSFDGTDIMKWLMSTIRKSVAILLCETIRRENKCRWYTPSGLRCKLCVKSSQEDPMKMKMYRKNRYDGCSTINTWYAKLTGSAGKAKLNTMNGKK
jgi:hypothetical protein